MTLFRSSSLVAVTGTSRYYLREYPGSDLGKTFYLAPIGHVWTGLKLNVPIKIKIWNNEFQIAHKFWNHSFQLLQVSFSSFFFCIFVGFAFRFEAKLLTRVVLLLACNTTSGLPRSYVWFHRFVDFVMYLLMVWFNLLFDGLHLDLFSTIHKVTPSL